MMSGIILQPTNSLCCVVSRLPCSYGQNGRLGDIPYIVTSAGPQEGQSGALRSCNFSIEKNCFFSVECQLCSLFNTYEFRIFTHYNLLINRTRNNFLKLYPCIFTKCYLILLKTFDNYTTENTHSFAPKLWLTSCHLPSAILLWGVIISNM